MSQATENRMKEEIEQLKAEENAVRIYLRERDSKAAEITRLKSLLAQCKEALKIADSLLLDYTDSYGSEQTGEYLSIGGRLHVLAVGEALAAIEKELG